MENSLQNNWTWNTFVFHCFFRCWYIFVGHFICQFLLIANDRLMERFSFSCHMNHVNAIKNVYKKNRCVWMPSKWYCHISFNLTVFLFFILLEFSLRTRWYATVNINLLKQSISQSTSTMCKIVHQILFPFFCFLCILMTFFAIYVNIGSEMLTIKAIKIRAKLRAMNVNNSNGHFIHESIENQCDFAHEWKKKKWILIEQFAHAPLITIQRIAVCYKCICILFDTHFYSEFG